jgi:hypothetical protein
MVLNFWSSEGKHESDLKSTERERKAESNQKNKNDGKQ